MYCQKCGTKNPDEANFCRECGYLMNSNLTPKQTNFDSNIAELHKKADVLMQSKLYKQAWTVYFEILDKYPRDIKAQQSIELLKPIFKKERSKENISAVLWFTVAFICSLIVSVLIIILMYN